MFCQELYAEDIDIYFFMCDMCKCLGALLQDIFYMDAVISMFEYFM